MPDLRAALDAAAQREQSSALPRYDDLLARHHRRRVRRLVTLVAGTALIIGLGATVFETRDPGHNREALRTDRHAPACGASDLGALEAKWTRHGLVLNGTMTVRNTSDHACLLGPGDIELQSARREPLLSEQRLVPVDLVPPEDVITVPPGRAAQAVLAWGGAYCGVPTPRVVLALRFPDGVRSAPVSGGVLPCLTDLTYYSHGQSSAARSGFRLVSPAG